RVRHAWAACQDLRSASAAEFPGARAFEVRPAESLRLAPGIGKALGRDHHEIVGTAARNMLARAAVALSLANGLGRDPVAQGPAVASAIQFNAHSAPTPSAPDGCFQPRRGRPPRPKP